MTIRIGDIVTVKSEKGDTFWREYNDEPRRWRVKSYLKPAVLKTKGIFDKILFEASQEAGPDGCRLEWCSQEEAVYVSLTGVGGATAKISDCTIVGRVEWPEELLRSAEDSARRLIGEVVF
jgi:hypothetical protein